MLKMGKELKNKRGMTLVEIVMTLVIVSIMALIMGPLLRLTVDLIDLKIERSHLKEEGTYALARMTREIRRVRDMESVITASATEFRFYDVEGDDIQYTIAGGAITRREGAAGTTYDLVDKVTALNFTYYYSGTNDVLTAIATPAVGAGAPTDIQFIEVEVELTSGTHVVTMRIHIKPINFTTEADLFI